MNRHLQFWLDSIRSVQEAIPLINDYVVEDMDVGQVHLIAAGVECEIWFAAIQALLKIKEVPFGVYETTKNAALNIRLQENRHDPQRRDFFVFLCFSEKVRRDATGFFINGGNSGICVVPRGVDIEFVKDISAKGIEIVEASAAVTCSSGTQIFNHAISHLRKNAGDIQRTARRAGKIILLFHGIRTFGTWRHEIQKALRQEDFCCEPIDYGYFRILQFLLPFGLGAWIALRRVRRQLNGLGEWTNEKEICVVAHSFGTVLVRKLIERKELQPAYLVVCGSIIRHLDDISKFNLQGKVVNEVSSNDWWPLVANSYNILYRYGSTGTLGFSSPGVIDRLHGKIGHSGFLKPSYCAQFLIPFFEKGHVMVTDHVFPKPSLLMRVVNSVPLEAIAVIFAGVFLLLW